MNEKKIDRLYELLEKDSLSADEKAAVRWAILTLEQQLKMESEDV